MFDLVGNPEDWFSHDASQIEFSQNLGTQNIAGDSTLLGKNVVFAYKQSPVTLVWRIVPFQAHSKRATSLFLVKE